MKLPALSALLLALSLWSMPGFASACEFADSPGRTDEDRLASAKVAVDNAAVIIDGEVLPRHEWGEPALVRPTRILKGPHRSAYRVVARTTCDRYPGTPGHGRRFVLYGGPAEYYEPYSGPIGPFIDRLLEERWGPVSKSDVRK